MGLRLRLWLRSKQAQAHTVSLVRVVLLVMALREIAHG